MQFAKALFLLLATSATTSAFAPARKCSDIIGGNLVPKIYHI